ncbi:cellulase family glycosylhydrolase [Candidatus Gottesmanbacteria bacterium]|nr:cellulase family glycosylhydrolase [Candidatus Gottesmanbacteria bacterium]
MGKITSKVKEKEYSRNTDFYKFTATIVLGILLVGATVYINTMTFQNQTSASRNNLNIQPIKEVPITQLLPSSAPTLYPFGLAGFTLLNPSPPYKAYTDFINQSGAKLISHSVRWLDIEPVKGEYNFESREGTWLSVAIPEYDQYCRRNDMQCTILFGNPPDWAHEKAGTGSDCLPIDEEDFDAMADAAAEVVKRFGSTTSGLQILNEPDFAHCYGGYDDQNQNGQIDYKDYALIVKKIYQAIKEVDPSYPVLVGRFASDPSFNQHSQLNKDRDGTKINLIDFLPQFLSYSQQELGGQYFDYLDIHYYEGSHNHSFEPFHSKDSYGEGGGGIRGKTFWARDLLTQYGGEDIPIIYSEIGYATYGYPETQTYLGRQAEEVFKLYAQGLSAGAKSLSWYCIGDFSTACVRTTPSESAFSLRLLDGSSNNNPPLTPRPSYRAYQAIAKELKDTRYNDVDDTDGIEGYLFETDENNKEVLWSRSSSPVEKVFTTSSLHMYSAVGEEENIQDGETDDLDGQKNGSITISISSPTLIVW